MVPHGATGTPILVLDHFGRIGCSWRVTDVEKADELVEAHYSHPVRIVAFNTAEGWSLD